MDGAQPTAVSEVPFVQLEGISTQAATPSEVSFENVKLSLQRKLPWLHQLPEFQKIKGSDKPIALVAGGPSVKNYVDDIKQFKTTMICGSSNDWAMENGIKPTYALICDPDPISINYFTKQDTETKYMLASCCDPKIFEHLKLNPIVQWHCHSEDIAEKLREQKLCEEYYAISGGCTVGLRALSMAIMFGYSNIHMFGYDSCLGDNDKHHAYDFSDTSEELGKIYNIKVGGNELEKDAKLFRCAGYQLAQAVNFKEFYSLYKDYFNPVVYGNGLIAEMINDMNKRVMNTTTTGAKLQ